MGKRPKDETRVTSTSPGDTLMLDGATVRSITVENFIKSQAIVIVSPLMFGAAGNGIADDTDALQAAHDALPANGGDVEFPLGYSFYCANPIRITKPNVTFRGVGNKTFRYVPSSIVYTGAADRFIDARGSEAFRIEGLGVLYSSPSFTGKLVDVSGNTDAASGPLTQCSLPTIRNSRLGPSTNRTGSATLVFADASVDLLIDQVFFSRGAPALVGRTGAGFSVRITIRNSWFSQSEVIPINGGGAAMLVEGCAFEPLANGKAGAFIDAIGTACRAVAWKANSHGDVAAAGGVWIDGYFQGFDFSANSMAGLGTIGGLGIVLRGPSTGVNVHSNWFELLDSAVVAATAGTDLWMGKNVYSNVTEALTNAVNLLAGDFTIAANGVTSIRAKAVTYAKMQDISATARLLGRMSAGAGVVEEIGVGGAFVMSGGQLQTAAHTGDVTSPANSLNLTLVAAQPGAHTWGVTQTFTVAPVFTDAAGTRTALGAGVASGLATLDGGGKLTASQIPASLVGAVVYQGTWNATTNSPALASGVGTKGFYYKVGTAGTTSIDGNANWRVGDTIIFDGTTWDSIDGTTNEVISVAGLFGVVTGAALKTALSIVVADISDFVAGIAAAIHAATTKATPVDADELGLSDSAASFGFKKLTWANLKATLKTYFDGLYAANIGVVSVTLSGVDFSVAGDKPIVLPTLPPGCTRVLPWRVDILNASGDLSAATFGVFPQAAAGGVALIAAGATISVSTAADGAFGNAMSSNTSQATSFVQAALPTPNTIYLRVGATAPAGRTGDVVLSFFPRK